MKPAAPVESAALWSACGLALLGAFAAVVVSAESLNLGNIILAQRYTGQFILKQPLAAWIYAVAVALAVQRVAPPLAASRRGLLLSIPLLVAGAWLGGILFLGGRLGGLAWPLVMAIRVGVMLIAILALQQWTRTMSPGTRQTIAWASALAALLNLILALVSAVR